MHHAGAVAGLLDQVEQAHPQLISLLADGHQLLLGPTRHLLACPLRGASIKLPYLDLNLPACLADLLAAPLAGGDLGSVCWQNVVERQQDFPACIHEVLLQRSLGLTP